MQLTYRDFESILKTVIRLSTEKDREKLLYGIVENGMILTHCDASVLYLNEDTELSCKIMMTASGEVSFEETPEVLFEEKSVCTHAAVHREILNIPDLYQEKRFDFSMVKAYDREHNYRTTSLLAIPLQNNEEELLGVLELINARNEKGEIIPFGRQHEIIVRSFGSLAAVEMSNIRYMDQIGQQLHSFVEALAVVIDERTPYNGTHTRKVAEYAGLLADQITKKHEEGLCQDFFDRERKEKLMLAALLHDIGKMVIPLSIMNRATRLDRDLSAVEQRFLLVKAYAKIEWLEGHIGKTDYENRIAFLDESMEFIHGINGAGYLDEAQAKRVAFIAEQTYVTPEGEEQPLLTRREKECLSIRRGTLTREDRKVMENHVVMTEKILEKVHFSKNYEDVPKWAAAHHELLDGTGYPRKLKSEDLDLETRILTVADIYDALTATDRPYKKPMPRKRAIEILRGMAAKGKVEVRLVEWLNEALDGDEKQDLSGKGR